MSPKGFDALDPFLFFEFLNVEKVFCMSGGFIVCVDGGDFHAWDNLNSRAV